MSNDKQQIKIVTLDTRDWEQYKKLRLRALREEPMAFGSSYDEMVGKDDEYWKARLAEARNGDQSWIVFAKNQKDLVGMVSAALGDQGIVQVHGVFVTTEARGMGVGTILMQRLLSVFAQNAQIKKIYLDVNTKQVAAVALYEKCGFTIVDSIEEQLGDGKKHTLYVMYREP